MAKLGARDRAQLVVIAYETGLVQPIGHALRVAGLRPRLPSVRQHGLPAAIRPGTVKITIYRWRVWVCQLFGVTGSCLG
jgi:hypothetical protein